MKLHEHIYIRRELLYRGLYAMRLLGCLFSLLCLILLFIHSGQANIGVSAQNAILINQTTGDVLYEKNAYNKQSIASITKVMTAIIAIESSHMDDTVKASRNAIHTEGSSIYLEEGEEMLLRDLVYGLMLRSGNDASVAIAEHIGGSEEGFVYIMNEKARWLGMTDTNFTNPHGLEEDNHYSTAYDMAILMKYAMQNQEFKEISSTSMYTAESRSYGWKNKNKLLTHLYPHSTGGKTGFTSKAGRTLLSTAEKNGHQLIAVTLNAPDDWNDHIQLFNYGFNQLEDTFGREKDEKIASPVTNQINNSFVSNMSSIYKQVMRFDNDG